ncbi:hypothetical protein [Actinomadura sp. NTSP31]|uniref:hypothetical protein n=1 Tax=Actinomadura sp. NTSP31 TaxID=1735447 RepID=UPI0035C1D8C8
MTQVRLPVGRLERCVSWWRTRRERDAAARHLDRLALATGPLGFRSVKVYPQQGSLLPFPLLLVYARGRREDASVLAAARVVHGRWAFFDAGRGTFVAPCRDAVAAAGRVDAILKHQMYPGTFPGGQAALWEGRM